MKIFKAIVRYLFAGFLVTLFWQALYFYAVVSGALFDGGSLFGIQSNYVLPVISILTALFAIAYFSYIYKSKNKKHGSKETA